ncbi:hypothetical protein ES288_D06G197900v1 [Gossypium darwinii]|uniref:ACT domain-containing protein ACR n=1 Tax=Gossypium darwinii TaxID=34276 RepID=A0A5D2CB87_GOSDA|nr:hypothetical protein ES288_D06G197900v1 [Gossypium darwinii]
MKENVSTLLHSFACLEVIGTILLGHNYDTIIWFNLYTRVVIDNNACEDATVIQVDSVNKHGILLEVVQVLTDMNLTITKAYISSDGGWFMDVFNVVDNDGNKIRDKEVMDYIQSVPAVYEEMILSSCTLDRKVRAMLRSPLRYMKQVVKSLLTIHNPYG